MKKTTRLSVLILLLLLSLGAGSQTARASCDDTCPTTEHEQTRDDIDDAHEETNEHLTDEFKFHQSWFVNDFYFYIYAVTVNLAHQLTVNGMHYMALIGSFFDAKQQLETQRVLQQETALAHNRYQPSAAMCTMGSSVRGLAAAESRATVATSTLVKFSQDRQLGHGKKGPSSDGPSLERENRMTQVKAIFCNKYDMRSKLTAICGGNRMQENMDTDFASLWVGNRTPRMDFTDATYTPDEENLMAMANNIFSHDILQRLTKDQLAIAENQPPYFEGRSLVAKRSVAENSFFSVAAQKAQGSVDATSSAALLDVFAKGLGVEDNKARHILTDRPSYFGLMETLSQRLYQDPDFYANLYDTPENVARKDVSLQAIGLMLDRDHYKSELRTEAMLSVYLEMELARHQEALQAIAGKGSAR